MLDYATLKFVWWLLMCFVLIAFAITGGMDIGVNFLLPILGKTDNQRRQILNTIGPTWEGNQVWLITFGAGMFAIWPNAYATAFSGLYLALFLVVVMLILRPPGFDYRSKLESTLWKHTWDTLLFLSSLILSLVFGIAIGNLFLGLPFSYDANLASIYQGGLLDLLTNIPLIFGLVSLSMCATQGAIFLQYKLSAPLDTKAQLIAQRSGYAFIISFIFAGVLVIRNTSGYSIQTIPALNTGFAPTQKIVTTNIGWLQNYKLYTDLWLLPIASILFTALALYFSQAKRALTALIFNSIAITTTVMTAATALFPFILPSRTNMHHSLTIWDACSSYLTLEWGLMAVIVLMPIILWYTAWVYKVMRGKVHLQHESY